MNFQLLLQLARCEERLGLVEQSLSSTQDQLSARVSEVRRNLIGAFIDRLFGRPFQRRTVSVETKLARIF